MQFIVNSELLGGGGLYPSSNSAVAPQFEETPEQKRRKQLLLLQALSGQQPKFEKDPVFHNVFGTGPGAIKSVTTKPDGSKTTAYNTPPVEAIPAAKAVEMAQGGAIGDIRGVPYLRPQDYINPPVQEAPQLQPIKSTDPNQGSFFSKISSFLGKPEVYGTLGALGQAFDPNGFGGRLGAHVQQTARNTAFDRYLQQRLSQFGGGTGSGNPFSGVGLLSPQEQLAATSRPLEELSGLSDIAYKQALSSGVETPEQMLQRQVLIEMLGQKQAQPNAGSFQNIELGHDGKRTPGITHKWLIDDITGNRIKYQGVVGATNPQQSGAGNADDTRQWYQKAVDEAKRNVDREASQYGKIQTDAFGNIVGIEWSDEGAPQRYQQSYYRHLTKAIKRFQDLGNLPAGFERPFESELAPQQVSKPKSSLLK